MKTENELATIIIGAAITVHAKLGPGLLESVYQECLCYELRKRGLQVDREKPLSINYDEIRLDVGYRVDILVESKVIVELKCVEKLNEIHLAQALTHLKMGDFRLGLLINFNVILLKHGIRRIANNLVT